MPYLPLCSGVSRDKPHECAFLLASPLLPEIRVCFKMPKANTLVYIYVVYHERGTYLEERQHTCDTLVNR